MPLQCAVEAIDDLKANHVVILDLRGLTDATDYFVIASGTSDAHVRGIADSVMEKMGRRGMRTHHVEGLNAGRWVLLDYVDFVIHLFHPETRSFYQLERLWGDAPELLASS
ncbi:MAG: ribosome silencing factor [Gemmatimonadota bacterium]